MKQKEIWFADLEPVEGSEQGGKSPIVIVSGETQNIHLPVIIICPLSSKINFFETCVVIKKSKTNGLYVDSEVLTFQIRTISKERLLNKIGTIDDVQLKDIFIGINDNLLY